MRVMRLLCSLLVLLPLAGAPPRPPGPFEAARIAVRTDSVEDGLPNPRVHSVHLDRRGRLWIGTQEGLAVSGSRGWTSVPLPPGAPSSYIRAIAETADGVLWFGTQDGGLWRFQQGAWKHFAGERELPVHRVNALLATREQGADVLWVGTGGGGLLRVDGDRVTRVAEVQEAWIWCLATLPLGPGGASEVWAGGEKGLWTGARGSWRALDSVQTGWQGGANALALRRTPQGLPEVWIAVWGQGVGHWDPQTRRFGGLDPAFPSRNPTSLAVATNAEGQEEVWVGTYDRGLVQLGSQGWRVLGPDQGVPSTGIYALQTNPAGKPLLWAGTRGAGLVGIDPGGWRTLGRSTGLPSDHANCFLETPEAFWIGTDRGLVRWDARGWLLEGAAQGLASEFIVDLALLPAPGGPELWAATLQGLARRKGGRWQRVGPAQGFPWQRVQALKVDQEADGTPVLLAGADGGLGRLVRGRWTLLTSQDGLPGKMVYAMLPVKDPDGGRSLWIGTRGSGLARWRDGRWTTFGAKEGLPGLSVYSLGMSTSPSGRRSLWIAMVGGAGLARMDPDHPERGFQTWTTATLQGLPSNTIHRLEVLQNRQLFLTTPRGVARVSLDGLEAAPGRVVAYSANDGLPSAATNAGASLQDAAGRLWVGTTQGIAVLDPTLEAATPPPPYPLLDKVRIQGQVREASRGLVLTHRERSLAVSWMLPLHHHGEDVRYQSQLVGLEAQPGPWTDAPSREFTTLPSGRYALRVWARDGLGRVSGPMEVPFQVKPAPWAAPWALALEGLAFLGLGASILRFRTRVLRDRTRRLEALVAERTQALEVANETLRRQSLTDPLTGLGNRRYLERAIQENLARVYRQRTSPRAQSHDLVLLLLDLDHFKSINDRFGHQAGDRVLLQTADLLRETVRTVDRVVRWGGEEFLVVAADVEMEEGPLLAERIRTLVGNHPFDIGTGIPLPVTVSLGFAPFPLVAAAPDALAWEQVLSLADQCLYQVKASGRNGWAGLLPPAIPPPRPLAPLPVDVDTLVSGGWIRRVSSDRPMAGGRTATPGPEPGEPPTPPRG